MNRTITFVTGVIKNGGAKPNIIPELSSMEFYIRTPSKSELQELKTRVVSCFEAAAKATGCKVNTIEVLLRICSNTILLNQIKLRIFWNLCKLKKI